MAHKLDSSLQQIQQLQVSSLESGEVLRAHASIQVTRLNPRELCQIIYYLRMGEWETGRKREGEKGGGG